MPRVCNIIVIPEDTDHANVARGYFHGRNVDDRAYQVYQKWTGKNGNFDRVRQWVVENVRAQARKLRRFGIIAMIDEDGTGPTARRQRISGELRNLMLPDFDPCQGRLLVLPVRNVETWMVWGARWDAAGRLTSPTSPAAFPAVDETHDYKRRRTISGQLLPSEPQMQAFALGCAIAELNPANPPAGVPPALAAILRPWSDFLDWTRQP